MRPQSLAEVAKLAAAGDSFDRCLHNFLDEFYANPRPSRLEAEPQLLDPIDKVNGKVHDAYLAATAEQLAYTYSFPVPGWVAAEERKLHKPWFASSLSALRAVLLLESPFAFRSRNLFVSENALSRA